MSSNDPTTISINPNNVNQMSTQQQGFPVGGQPVYKNLTPQQAWEQVISKLPLSLIMAIIDGFHDFCKGERVAGNVSNTPNDGEDDVSDDISDIVKIAYFRQAEKLLRVELKKIGIPTPTDNINDMIAAMTNGIVGSMSNYERRTVKAIENRPELAPVLGQTRKSYSIQEIVNAPNSDNSENEDGKTGRPQLWKEICGEVVTVPESQEANRNAAIAAGPALYDKSLYLYWDPEYTAPASGYWRENKPKHPLKESYQAYDPIFLKRLGSFIYTYLYPELKWSDDDENKTSIVFDMASGCLGKIFGAFDNGFVTSDICPQTVSDSAGTSENQIKSIKKGSLNRYNFCETEDINNQDTIESDLIAILNAIGGGAQKFYKAQGNVLTWKYNIDDSNIIHTRIIYAIGQNDQYTQSTYCYFKLYICTRIETNQGLSDWEVNELNFNIAEKNGPSVAYLSSLVYALENNADLPNPPLKKAMINITSVIQSMKARYPLHFLQALLFDIKRCGDWEQSRSAQLQNNKKLQLQSDNYKRVLFGTGDILCVTYNRECRGNSMWHYEGKGGVVGWNIELYRNPNITKSLAKEIADALEVVRKSTTIEKMLDRICHSSDFMKRIRALKTLVGQHGHKAVYYYSGNKAATENKIESRIEKLITMICRIGMKDIYFKCEVFERLLASPDNILKSIVGPNIQGNVCMTVTNYYLMGLNYLRDIFTKMDVKSTDAAIRFLIFVNAPNKNEPSYFTQEINASIPPLNDKEEEDFTNNFNSPTDDNNNIKLLAAEDSGIAAIILAKRIIFRNGYEGDPQQDKLDEFLAIYEWLDAARKQLSDNDFSINGLVTKYADSINGASPESDLKKALDLIREIKTTTIKNILPAPGVQAATATDPSGYKKTTINHILQLGEVDPIFQLDPQDDNTWVFNKAFGAKSSLGAFKFRIKDMKKLADYLKLMYYKGFKIRARFGTSQTQNNNRLLQGGVKKPTDDWTMFSNMVKQTIPTLKNPDFPLEYIGWTKEQMMGNSFRNYVSREVESAWPKLRKENEDTEYGKVLQDFTDFDCPALYRIVRDGTIVRSYVMTDQSAATQYCNTIYCKSNGKPYVEGLNISRLARKKYNLDIDGLDPETKINIVAEEIESFSRWLTILLDIQNDGNGLSPFSVNNLDQRATFLRSLSENIAQAATAGNEKAIDLINEMGGLDEFSGDSNISKFENMMDIAVNSIKYVNADLPGQQADTDEGIDEDDLDLEGGTKKMQKGGAVPDLAKQKEIQLTMLSYLFLNMSGKARALINPLTDPRQLLVILQKMESIGINNGKQEFVNYVKNSAAYKVLNSNGQVTLADLNMNSSQATFELLSLYSNMIYFFGYDYDFLGTYNVFDDIKYNFIASINSEMSPLTDEQGNPYDGYNFKLLDAVLKIFIMINNLHIRDPKGQPRIPYIPPNIHIQQTTDTANEVMSDAFASLGDDIDDLFEELGGGNGKKRGFDDIDDTNKTEPTIRRRVKIRRTTIRERYLDNIENNIDLLEGLNDSIISENEQNDMNTYFDNPDHDTEEKVKEYNNWLIENANSIGFDISVSPPTIQSQIVSKLLYLILKSKLETGPPGARYSAVPIGIIKRELDEMLKYTIPYSQSIKPDPTRATQYFILPHIKLLLAFSAIQSFLPATKEERSKDPLFMLFFQNSGAIQSGTGIDFAWTKWQDNTIINSIYRILYKLLLFEEQGVYTPVTDNVFMGGKKKKTRKKRKKNRKTRKAKKKQRKKNNKTRGKGNKRKGKKRRTRGRKKKN
uniref:Uncharacterized protein n=1 Tax=viral metagenome TaxID=1070528 RepID=A0A6C0CPU2_9ZZZZ